MASSGFQADVRALQKLLAARHSVSLRKSNYGFFSLFGLVSSENVNMYYVLGI